MKTIEELKLFEDECNSFPLQNSYGFAQDETGTLIVTVTSRAGKHRLMHLRPCGKTVDDQELWKYDFGSHVEGPHPVGTLDSLFVTGIFG
jgi:hypothetical protein